MKRIIPCLFLALLVISAPTGAAVFDFIGGYFSPFNRIIDFDVGGDILYMATEGELVIVNAIDDYVLYWLSDNTLRGLLQEGDYLYITTDSGLKIMDVSNPRNPGLVGQYAFTPGDGENNLRKNGDFLYVADSDFFRIFDVSNPASPLLASETPTGYPSVTALFLADGHLYVRAAVGNDLHVFDLDGSYLGDFGGGFQPIAVSYDAALDNIHALYMNQELAVYAGDDPLSPTELSRTDIADFPRGLASFSNFAFCSSSQGVVAVHTVPGEESYYMDEIQTGHTNEYSPEVIVSYGGYANPVVYFCMGQMIFFVRFNPDAAVGIIPDDYPIVLPPEGGSFSYVGSLGNIAEGPTLLDAWIMAQLPQGGLYGPLLLANDVFLNPGQTVAVPQSETVPGMAPPGTYRLTAYTGVYPDSVVDSSFFYVEKEAR